MYPLTYSLTHQGVSYVYCNGILRILTSEQPAQHAVVNNYRQPTNDVFTALTIILPTDRNLPITTDKRCVSFTANNITAKLTNQFPRTRLITFD